jgi:hypothetical protein
MGEQPQAKETDGMEIRMDAVRRTREALLPPRSVRTLADCLAAVERLGFVWGFTPGTELLPALFPALDAESEGQRWEMMWGWKDALSASREAFYGKVAAGRPTLVSREWLPAFYALTGNTGDADDDLAQMAEGARVHEFSYKVVQYLKEYGPTGTRTLQQRLTDGTRPARSALEKALAQLDTGMLIAKCGTEGGNSIANVWDLFPRFHPEAVETGTEIPTREAAVRLLQHFFGLTPAVGQKDLGKLFPWNEGHQKKALTRLLEAGELKECTFEGKPGYHHTTFTG